MSSTAVFYILFVVLMIYALSRRDGSFAKGMHRAMVQIASLAPRMIVALIAAGFIAKLLPTELIASYLGKDAGLLAILIATVTGMVIPAGPVVAFAIAAVFAKAGASTPALIAFVTSWSVFAAHRIIIFEIPLLGTSFLKMRLASVLITPLLAGVIALAADKFIF